MPVIYNIVTNDEYEIPIACDIEGARAAADFLGMSENYMNKCICLGKWSRLRKEKAVIIEKKRVTQEHRRMVDRARWRRWYQSKKAVTS